MVAWLLESAAEIKRAARASIRRPSLSVAVVATLALGLGAAAAVFSVARSALLEPLPYRDAGQLVRIGEVPEGSAGPGSTSLPLLLDWRRDTRAFAGLEGYEGTNVNGRVGDQVEMLRGWRVTPGFFRLLGVGPSVGRTWSGDGDIAVPEVVVSHRLASRLGGEQSALSEPLVIDGTPFSVIGVLPEGFHFGDDADLWLPLTPGPDQRVNRANRWLFVVGRLRVGMELEAARADLARVTRAVAAEYPGEMQRQTLALSPLREVMLGKVKPILVTLLSAVGVLLLITCANLGALMLLRNLDRRDELLIRAAVGASRRRLASQLFLEGLLLALFGAAAGIAIGAAGLRILTGAIPAGVRAGMPYLSELRLDPLAIAMVLAIAIVMAAAFALWPARRAASTATPLASGTRLSMGRRDRRIRRILVVSQLGFTVVLLIGAAQLAESFVNLVGQRIGVSDPDRLLTMNMAASGPAYPTDVQVQAFYEEVIRRVEGQPGVMAVAAVNELPLSGSGITSFEPIEAPTPQAQRPAVAMRIVAGDYFEATGVPLRAGRLVSPRDRAETPRSAVVSASLAERLGGGRSMLGRRIRLTRTGNTEWEIVGVVDDVHMSKLDVPSPPTVYVHHLQTAENRMPLVVRTSSSTEEIAAAVRAIVRSIDPAVPVYSVSTLGQQLRDSGAVFTRRFPLLIGGVFAGAALLLAIVGLYSLAAHEAMSRRRELMIRQVLGATPGGVRAGLVRDGLVLAALGVCLGAVVAVPASGLLRTLLFGVGRADLRIYGGVAVAVLIISLGAVAWPAWRSTVADLGSALRA